jgi:anti-sigma-K factor RskA
MDRHDDIREQLTDYVLGELPADAREPIRIHLAGCRECAAEARELSAAFQGIGFAETPSAPPADLKARVLAQLGRESQSGARPAVLSQPQASKPRGWVVQPVWVALAATAVLVLGGLVAVSQQRAARAADDVRRADAAVARLAAEAAAVATQADLAVSILTAPDMRRIDLEGFDASRNATARAYWSAATGLLIVADRLPVPPPGRIYQVWLIGGGGAGPLSAGLIPAGGGRGMLIAPSPGRVTGGSITIAVTDEPAGGVPAPTGSKHLVGSL